MSVEAGAKLDQALIPLDHQRMLVDPKFNPTDAAPFFIFNFCKTCDEDRGNEERWVPVQRDAEGSILETDFKLKLVRALDAPRLKPSNLHDEKSRRMLHTWLTCLYNLWALMWVPNHSTLIISKSQDHVDDGGRNSLTFSIFGRIRYAWERSPDHVRKPVLFSHMSASCPENGAFLMGRAPTRDAGRGGGFSRVWVDECAFIDWMRQIHAAIDPACKFGKIYMSTVNGPDNVFAEVKRNKLPGWTYHECDWTEDPEKTEGLRDTEPGAERDRYGAKVSNWIVTNTSSLNDDEYAREYGRRYEKSTTGRVLREFNRDIHVRREASPLGRLVYDPNLPVRVGLDFGHERRTVAVIAQPVAQVRMRVIGVYYGEHRNAPENAAGLIDRIRVLTDLRPGTHEWKTVSLVPDPSAVNEEHGSGVPPLTWYLSAGFENWMLPLVTGAHSVVQGNRIVRVVLSRAAIEFDEVGCGEDSFRAMEAFRVPVDPKTGIPTSNVPIHDIHSHFCDGLRYVVTSVWTADMLPEARFYDNEPTLVGASALPLVVVRGRSANIELGSLAEDDRAVGRMADSDGDRARFGLTIWDAHRRDF